MKHAKFRIGDTVRIAGMAQSGVVAHRAISTRGGWRYAISGISWLWPSWLLELA